MHCLAAINTGKGTFKEVCVRTQDCQGRDYQFVMSTIYCQDPS